MKKGYFSQKLADWYCEHRRNLPWRLTSDPYRIWLSEIILQQTRVAQGLPYYKKFVQRYPDVKSLAIARDQDVLRLWEGLGYYSRARNLVACARTVVKEHRGKFPGAFDGLKTLPGIGDYTAAAIASIAFGERVPVVDGNVFRVLSRMFGLDANISSAAGRNTFRDLATSLISGTDPGQHNQALMEFGALQCVPVNPDCDSCIFKKHCVAFRQQSQRLYPVKDRKTKPSVRYFNYLVVKRRGKILMNERKGNDIWKGLFDFPLYEDTKSLPRTALLKRIDHTSHGNAIHRVSDVYKHVLTHQVIFARFTEIERSGKRLPGFETAKWYAPSQIADLPKPQLIVRFFRDRALV